jgi:23S rRNA (adenine2503-C2)-methyltransferase
LPLKGDPLGLSLEGWEKELAELRQPAYRAKQVYSWLHSRHALDYAKMSNLPRELRHALSERQPIRLAAVACREKSRDGSVKYSFRANDGAVFESVYLPSRHGSSLCVSAQAGCSFRCKFCATGKLGLTRNLTCGEMLQQVYHLANEHLLSSFRILLMGMGEALANLPEVVCALRHLQHADGMAFSPSRITVSTIGMRGRIARLAKELPGVELALSLHFTSDAERARHMPAAEKLPIAEILEEIADAESLGRVTLEYVLLEGVNDSLTDAAALVFIAHGVMPRKRERPPGVRLRQQFRGIPAWHVNLIEYNPVPGAPYKPSPQPAAETFLDYLKAAGINATYRRSAGRDISAACGMLAGKSAD